MFIFNKYWGNWSRQLTRSHPRGPFVEVDLTPIGGNFHDSASWDKVKGVWIRLHCTQRDRSILLAVAQLPELIVKSMVKNIGGAMTHRLMSDDVLGQIDWDKYAKMQNGGAPLDKIKKDQFAQEHAAQQDLHDAAEFEEMVAGIEA